MRLHLSLLVTSFLLGMVLAVSLGPRPALAHGGSVEDQIACTPDVYRLCSKYIPDEDSIVACLQRRKSQLSAACHAVFTRPDKSSSDDDN